MVRGRFIALNSQFSMRLDIGGVFGPPGVLDRTNNNIFLGGGLLPFLILIYRLVYSSRRSLTVRSPPNLNSRWRCERVLFCFWTSHWIFCPYDRKSGNFMFHVGTGNSNVFKSWHVWIERGSGLYFSFLIPWSKLLSILHKGSSSRSNCRAFWSYDSTVSFLQH